MRAKQLTGEPKPPSSVATEEVPPLTSMTGLVLHRYDAGVIGTGFMGQIHARAVRAAGGRLIGVAGATPERGARAARALSADRPFADVQALLTSPDVNVVHICAPHHLHHPLALRALQAGKHVICEAPFTMTGERAQELVSAAQDRGLVATVAFVHRFHPQVREAGASLAEAASGGSPSRRAFTCRIGLPPEQMTTGTSTPRTASVALCRGTSARIGWTCWSS